MMTPKKYSKEDNPFRQSIDWNVLRQPIKYMNHESNWIEHPDLSVLIRNDNGHQLHSGAVSSSFQYTNTEQIQQIAETFAIISGFPLIGYDEFKGGSKVVGYLKSDKSEIAGYPMDDFLVFGSGFDGKTSFFIGMTNNLWRCNNQWGRILQNAKIKNTRNHELRRDELVKTFEQYLLNRAETYDRMERWADIRIGSDAVKELTFKLATNGVKLDSDADLSTKMKNKIISMSESVESEMNDVGDNLFGWFNGVTHYTTHKLTKTHDVMGNLFSSKNTITNKAISLANEFALELS